MKIVSIVWAVLLVNLTFAHTIPAYNQINKQVLAKRDSNAVDVIYNDLTLPEQDFINNHLNNLTNATGSKCDKCHHKMKYGRSLLDKYPENKHLISLLLFKACIADNKGSETKCESVDFFVTTTSSDEFQSLFNGGTKATTGVSFYDNDFLKVLSRFNVSSSLDLDYYCFFKWNVCEQPVTPNVTEKFDLASLWPVKNETQKLPPVVEGELETFNVLHISDFHIQLRYQVGSESNCSHTPCCLPESVNTALNTKNYNFTSIYKAIDSNIKNFEYSFYPDARYENGTYVKGKYYDYPKARGYNADVLPASTFGAYMCDSPEVLLNNTLGYISTAFNNKDFEFTIFTGDLVDHDVIHCDANTTKEAEVRSFGLMKHYLKDIPVYPALGNHDTFPYGQLSPLGSEYNNTYNWNDDLMSQLWVQNGWLNASKSDHIKNHYSGFSTVTDRGLKIIALNSNAYYQKNLWAYLNISTEFDRFGQWDFLINELVESEAKGQRVWIMSHIPPSQDTLPIQASIFAEIVKRFSPYTIANIFYGHTHKDQFNILYSSNDTEVENAIAMAWISQSVTPLSNYNPSWRYYEVQDKTFNILNSYNYYTQLNETFVNDGAEPQWSFEYSARETYDPHGTWPETAPLNATFWAKYVASNIKNQTNIEFNQLYANLQYRLSPYVPVCKNGTHVSDECYEENWCVVSAFTIDDTLACGA